MNQNDKSVSQFFTPAAIILGSLIISWSIMNGPGVGAKTTTAQNAPTQTRNAKEVNMKGATMIGKADAPLTIAYWYDYQCPFCQKIEQASMASIIKDYVDTGKVKIVFKDLQFLGADSQKIGILGRAVWETVPGQFYKWHKAIFDNQGQENSGWATDAKLLTITTGALGADLANRVMALAQTDKDRFQKLLDADKAEGATFGAKSTPTMIIGSTLIVGAQPYEQIKAAIEAGLKAK